MTSAERVEARPSAASSRDPDRAADAAGDEAWSRALDEAHRPGGTPIEVAQGLDADGIPSGEFARFGVPGGGTLSLRGGHDLLDLKRGVSAQAGVSVFGATVKWPSRTLQELVPESGVLPPSIERKSLAVSDKLVGFLPWVGPAIKAIPGDKKEVIVGFQPSEGADAAGRPTDVGHLAVSLSTSPKPVDITPQINGAVKGALSKVPLSPAVRAQIQEHLGSRLDLLFEARTPDGKPVLQLVEEAGGKLTVQVDVVVETAEGDPLDVKSVEVYATLKGAASASVKMDSPKLPKDLIKYKNDVSLETSGSVSVRYEAPPDQRPPAVIAPHTAPLGPDQQFVRPNEGDTRRAFLITEQLLQGIASVRYPDGYVEDGVPVSTGTSVWDLSRVAEGRNHGHPALDLANRVNHELKALGALGPDEFVGSTEGAAEALGDALAGADPATRERVADALANPLGLNFGLPDIDRRNQVLERGGDGLPAAAHFRGYFLPEAAPPPAGRDLDWFRGGGPS